MLQSILTQLPCRKQRAPGGLGMDPIYSPFTAAPGLLTLLLPLQSTPFIVTRFCCMQQHNLQGLRDVESDSGDDEDWSEVCEVTGIPVAAFYRVGEMMASGR